MRTMRRRHSQCRYICNATHLVLEDGTERHGQHGVIGSHTLEVTQPHERLVRALAFPRAAGSRPELCGCQLNLASRGVVATSTWH